MADLGVRVAAGAIVASGSSLAVVVDGARFPVVWWGAYAPEVGANVRVLICSGEASVLGPAFSSPRSATGTVAGAPAGGLLPVTVGALTVQCRYGGTAPSIGTQVLLSWESTTPWVLGSAVAYTPPASNPPPPPPAPPPATTSGTLYLAATDAGTWTNEWWSLDVRQGSYGGGSYHGAWFYGSAPSQLAGATITRTQIRLGSRLHIGSYNSSLTLSIQRVTQGSKAGGSPGYVDGPFTASEPVNAGPQWVDLGATVGQDLVNAGSGGMGINGGTYGGVVGISSDPASGQLALDWTR